MPARVQYQMHVMGRVGPAACGVFAEFGVRVEPTPTVLSGAMDQAALHGLLARVRGLGLGGRCASGQSAQDPAESMIVFTGH